MSAAGLSNDQMAELLDIDRATFYRWLKDNSEFCDASKSGKAIVDGKVERSLFERACGYEHLSEEIFCKDGEITRADTIKKYPPDSTAAIFWLKNRQPDKWRDVYHNINLNDVEAIAKKVAVVVLGFVPKEKAELCMKALSEIFVQKTDE